jgi:rhodanese-related sulfurtransferase
MTGTLVARITPAELVDRLESDEPITVLDVRGRSYRTSDRKIAGAVRIDPHELGERYQALPHKATIVAYCT